MSELGQVLELMHTCDQRWRSIRAEGHEWHHHERMEEAFMRGLERRPRVRGRRAAGHESGECREPWRVAIEQPDKARAEFAAGGETVVQVLRDRTAWTWSPAQGAQTYEPGGPPAIGAGSAAALLQPYQLLPAVELEVRGRTAAAGRAAFVVRAVPVRRDDGEPERDIDLGRGADECHLLVDAERGVILRSEARLGGAPFRVLEMEAVAFDEALSDDMFPVAPPEGEAFEAVEHGRSVMLEELPGAVGFQVLLPGRPPDWHFEVGVRLEPPRPRHGVPASLRIEYSGDPLGEASDDLVIAESADPMPLWDWMEWREVDGMLAGQDHNVEPAVNRVRVEREGTHVELSSYSLPIQALVEAARSLVPLPTRPPALRHEGPAPRS